MLINGVEIVCTNGEMKQEELAEYVSRGLRKYGNNLRGMKVTICEDDDGDVDLEYIVNSTKFKRLRRITGYLVGDLSRWNDGKLAEEEDRVKHTV